MEYKELVFAPLESLYKAHLHNLMYMNLEGLYPELHDHKRKWLDMIAAIANTRSTAVKLSSPYYLTKRIVRWLIHGVKYQRGFRMLLAQINLF